MASIPTWNITKHTCMAHRNPILMHGFHSIPRVGIQHVSLKAYRRWDSTCHRMMIVARINEPSDLLDLGHRDSARVALYFGFMDKGSFFCQFWKLGFFLVSECEIFAHKGHLEGDCRSSPHTRDVSICTMKCRRRQCRYVSNHVMEHVYV